MTDSKEDGLKPCPFCNGPAALWEERDGYYVGCGKGVNDCAVHPRMKAGLNTWQPSAIAAWNRRASSPPVGGSGEVDIDVDELAGEIRYVDGEHKLGAGALAEALAPYLRLVVRSTLAAPVPNGVPEGWRLVPVEPTYEMADAGDNFMPQFVLEEAPTPAGIDVARDVWAAMLAASPVTPEGLSGGEK